MNNAMFKKLKRKPKWKLIEEQKELQLQQKKLRMETDLLKDNLSKLKDDEIAALQGNDGGTIALIENKISMVRGKIEENDRRYKANAEVLEIYSKIVKNNREGAGATTNSVIGVVTGLGGLVLGGIGLHQAYKSDMEGTLHNKKTLDWIKGLPILRNIGK